MQSNAILQITERAFVSAFTADFRTVVSGGQMPVIVSDESQVKPAMPYIVARCKTAEAIIDPKCGIFKVTASAIYRSHVKETTPEQRETIIIFLNNFAYSNPAETLNTPGFTCYGFVPLTGSMTVDPETKSYAYDIEYTLYCMPRSNP